MRIPWRHLLDRLTGAWRGPASDHGRPAAHRWHSVSSTREYERCPRRYRFSYVERRPYDRPSPPSWRLGSVVHAGLEAGYRHRMDRPDDPRSAARQAAVRATRASWEQYDLGTSAGGVERAIWLVTRALVRDVLDLGTILGVEVPFRQDLDDRDRVTGFADLVLGRGTDTIEIVDHKVTRRRASGDELRRDFQLNVYGHLAARRWPHATTILASHHYPTGPDVVRVTLDAERMAAAFGRVLAAREAIGHDRVFAPTPSASCDHCPWLPSCLEGRVHLERRSEPPAFSGGARRTGR